jgi:ABC-type bacteriocin/lantibiotic exporter with double-glycine peptidase domain
MSASELARQLRIEIERSMATLRRIADEIEAIDGHERPVPYRSQWEEDAQAQTGDCGSACLAMLIEWRSGSRVNIDHLSYEAGMRKPGKNYTLPADLINAAAFHGLHLEQRTNPTLHDVKLPAIVLVHYGGMPRMDTNYTKGHWVVVTKITDAAVTYHDPDWKGSRMFEGKDRTLPRAQFIQAMADNKADGNTPGMMLVVE